MSDLSGPGRIAAALLATAFLSTAFLAGGIAPARAHDYTLGDLRIGHPWTRATAPTAKVGAGYMTIANRGGAPDRLVSASAAVAGRVEIHEMRMDGGVMRMRELAGGINLPAGAEVALRPGGNHLMLMDLRAPLKEGASVPVVLVFERAGRVEVELKVEPPGGPAGGAHGHGHGHGAGTRAPAHNH